MIYIISWMRYSAEHKKETRERIVRAASRQFRRRGREGVAIAELMRKLNLTHGGFYRHFGSKEALLVEAVEKGFEDVRADLKRAAQKRPGSELKAVIEGYLSLEHCSNPADGCPMAALASEITRYPRAARLKIDRAMSDHINQIAYLLPGATESERRQNALVLFSGMGGALTLARSVADEKARRNILQAAREFYVEAFCN
jgi:TetR/AcrR family transcriptional regulator, transcriptional repressor for nem operon